MSEFNLIQQYFTHPTTQTDLGVGDDAALFRVSAGHQCVVTSDMLVANRHFFDDVDARALGHKALAVNLSDLAAMGAKPLGFTLSLALPFSCMNDGDWLAAFSGGLMDLARRCGCDLMGGDTTRTASDEMAALVINITAFGEVPMGAGILRSGAQAGDDVWVSGTLGDAAMALGLLVSLRAGEFLDSFETADLAVLRGRLERPTPRMALGLALRGVASAMLDVSDGVAGDLMHVLKASHVSAALDVDALPLSPPLQRLDALSAWRLALTGGDDYELCFTANAARRDELRRIALSIGVPLTRIGSVVACEGELPSVRYYSLKSPHLVEHMVGWGGYNHFL